MSKANNSEIIIYQTKDGTTKIDVRLENETVWLTLDQMAELFGRDKSTISRHIKNIFNEEELNQKTTVAKYATVQIEGNRNIERQIEYYNLDVIIAVGYRVKSPNGTQFRKWATAILHEYLQKGFAMNDEVLKNAGGGIYWKELLERIRDIRTSEKLIYRQILDIYATSIDYDPKSEMSIKFFKTVQNKIHYAAHGHTAAEIIEQRVNSNKPNMGLTNFKGERPLKSEVTIAKNYLNETELKRLNSLATAFFDAAEFQATEHIPMYMKDWIDRLDEFVVALHSKKLIGSGSTSHEKATLKAENEYKKFKRKSATTLNNVEKEYLKTLKQLESKVKNTEKKE